LIVPRLRERKLIVNDVSDQIKSDISNISIVDAVEMFRRLAA